ncbi:oxidoreductase [Nocardia sp. NPDC052566]|uniref:oxidoreductase n=1 Tax=Nocardia sp. NPDC052566 TaxID=3364330 RepID=UPI0037C84608
MVETLETLSPAPGLTITRMGYGAMQLSGPNAFGPPHDRAEAVAVLREAVELGVTHIDTAEAYGPTITNEIINEALHPYDGITIATKVGARRGANGEWSRSPSVDDLRAEVYENLDHLGVDVLDVVYLRYRSDEANAAGQDSIAPEFTALAELRDRGLIRHLGLSGVSSVQLTEAQSIAPVVAVQNLYNLAYREDDELVDRTAREGIVFASFFPLGGFSPLQSDALSEVAIRLGAPRQQVALAWLLQRSTTSIVIPGTSSRDHLRQNIAAVDLKLPVDALEQLDSIGR